MLKALCLVSSIALVAVGSARAHFLPHRAHLSRAARVAYFERSVAHDREAVGRVARSLAGRDNSERVELVRVARWHRAAFRWHRDLLARARRALLPAHLSSWLCIHRFEGSWRDAGAPYWGGLQMDLAFMAAYGRALLRAKGTADHWTPLEQMQVAEVAWRSRGFWPWPNTARSCGLL